MSSSSTSSTSPRSRYDWLGRGGPHHNPHTAGYTRHGDDSGQPGGTPVFTIRVTPDMCAEIAACSGRLIQHRPVYIWDAPIDDWAKVAADVATDFIPGVALGKTLHEAYERIQDGEDPVGVLMSASFDGVLGLIPGGKTGRKLHKALDKADDVADAAGDLRKVARGPQALPAPKASPAHPRTPAPEHGTFHVDPRGNAVPTPKGGRVTGSPDGRFIQARDAAGNPTGVRIDGPHRPAGHPDPRAQQPHGHVPGVSNPDGTPWLPIK